MFTFCSKKCWNKIVWHFIGVNTEHYMVAWRYKLSFLVLKHLSIIFCSWLLTYIFSILWEGFPISALPQNVCYSCNVPLLVNKIIHSFIHSDNLFSHSCPLVIIRQSNKSRLQNWVRIFGIQVRQAGQLKFWSGAREYSLWASMARALHAHKTLYPTLYRFWEKIPIVLQYKYWLNKWSKCGRRINYLGPPFCCVSQMTVK